MVVVVVGGGGDDNDDNDNDDDGGDDGDYCARLFLIRTVECIFRCRVFNG